VPHPTHHRAYDAKRSAILDVAAGLFGTHGYRGTSTALICRTAGISSGTFFHYFPTKLDALSGVLESGCDALSAQVAEIEQRATGLDAIFDYATTLASEIGDSSYAVFAAGLAEVESEPRIAAALRREAELVSAFLARQIEAGQLGGTIRPDLPAASLARWATWLLDGAAQAATAGPTPAPAPAPAEIISGLRTLLEPR
jgi:AcrR family transcriptional regulator